ncbi:MAG: hypothetical protein US58_C0022G0017 [Candidatus Magasanikbacteria bacterium GW2011_GWA2_37_8]|uniref:Glycosyltransferase subfamily 4-like N-terminal domain-containing protein n=1 Tax=Candidatus Magasanikbacteria bacterium GW2011_GWA2_37_8 TaxID=1619036 RepID=A0A0G0HAH5_9BACT|nr:MAG: hypothetical protein US58_C0022G0017 [Candidatus Magasanikbacteria bacterium GW2011_GWA2_37_8]
MSVLHIIPSAFEYFTDINTDAWKWVNKLNKKGVDTDVFTLQYGVVPFLKMEEKGKGKKKFGTRNYTDTVSINEAMADWDKYELIHLHCPFLGAAGKILRWKKLNPSIPLVVTIHRPVRIVDLIALGIRWYNGYYLPKIIRAADIVWYRYKEDRKDLTDDQIVKDFVNIYSQLLTNKQDI